MDDNVLNLTYNLTDMLNKIGRWLLGIIVMLAFRYFGEQFIAALELVLQLVWPVGDFMVFEIFVGEGVGLLLGRLAHGWMPGILVAVTLGEMCGRIPLRSHQHVPGVPCMAVPRLYGYRPRPSRATTPISVFIVAK